MQQPTIETSSTDILILGSGGAGLFAALHAYDADPRLEILVTVKGLLGKSCCTRMVQGGYNTAPSAEKTTDGLAMAYRAFSLVRDSRDTARAEHGCWRCHSLYNCTEVCPKHISPTQAIKGLKRDMVRAWWQRRST